MLFFFVKKLLLCLFNKLYADSYFHFVDYFVISPNIEI